MYGTSFAFVTTLFGSNDTLEAYQLIHNIFQNNNDSKDTIQWIKQIQTYIALS